MRFRSAANRGRSKSYFLLQGIQELWWVANAPFRRASSTALTPLNDRLWTLMAPSSIHPTAELARAARARTRNLTRMASKENHNSCRAESQEAESGGSQRKRA